MASKAAGELMRDNGLLILFVDGVNGVIVYQNICI